MTSKRSIHRGQVRVMDKTGLIKKLKSQGSNNICQVTEAQLQVRVVKDVMSQVLNHGGHVTNTDNVT